MSVDAERITGTLEYFHEMCEFKIGVARERRSRFLVPLFVRCFFFRGCRSLHRDRLRSSLVSSEVGDGASSFVPRVRANADPPRPLLLLTSQFAPLFIIVLFLGITSAFSVAFVRFGRPMAIELNLPFVPLRFSQRRRREVTDQLDGSY